MSSLPSLHRNLAEELSPDDVLLSRGDRLSTEAERLQSWFGLPISLLPVPRSGRGELQSFVLEVNHLIAGKVERLLPWDLLEASFPSATLDGLRTLFCGRFAPLWSAEESAGLRRSGPAQLAMEWRRRARAGAWAPSLHTIREEADLPRIWSELGAGDFDVGGRGRDYTEGMHYFQAARALGVETLLEHMGAFRWQDGFLLDVLGGDGYILRLFEALNRLRHLPLALGECSSQGLSTAHPGPEAGRLLVERYGGGLVLALEAGSLRPGGGHARTARWIAALPSGTVASAPFAAPALAVETLRQRGRELPGGQSLDELLLQAGVHLGGVAAGAGTRVITNDISPHMFFSAGLWGMPTREDARRLSRTFRAGALDGVVFAYGTHHVAGIAEAIRESFTVLRPGGRVILQDFLDEGPVGNWFHNVVDPFSRTGHDFVHIGPVQLAVQLLLAGFREVQMFEMEDPFLFAVSPDSAAGAREIACTYLLGMYGLGDSHLRERHCLEGRIRQVLSYVEIGSIPLLEEDFVYIPRRATGASAIRPQGDPGHLSLADRALVEALTGLLALEPAALAERFGASAELLDVWFRRDGSRWGLTPAEVAAWFDLVESWRRARVTTGF